MRHETSLLLVASRALTGPPGLFVVLLLAAVLAGCGGDGRASGDGRSGGGDGESPGGTSMSVEVPRNVRALTVVPADLNEYLAISGPLRPLRGADLSAEEGGRVAGIPHDKGSTLDAGDVLIMLDRGLLEAQKDAAEARRDLGAYNEDRTRKLYDANSVSKIEMLQIETELRSLEAVARVAQIRYERAAIRAPFAGIVTNRFVELGQLVVPGMLVARIVDPYVLKLEGALTEREIGFVRKGGNATVTCQGVRGTDPVATQASIHWVGFEADPLTGKFPVEIRIENPDLVLRPGVIGCARVVKMHHENVIVIPRDAVVQRATGPVAYVVAGGIAQERRLTLGPDQGLMVVVKDGLRAGDSLVVRGQRDIHDGSAVVIREATTAADGSLPTDPDVVRQTRTDRETPQSQATRGGGSR